jgi:putative tryptophan/tyrosine transport system substrate-binding protein
MNATTCIIVIATIVISVRLADAQTSMKIPRIGFLSPENHQSGRFEAFRQGLRELGYVEGKNIAMEHRSSEDNAQLQRLATELLREKVAVLVTQGRATVQAKNIAANVPHVFGMSGDPVEAGLVRSLAQPGGNMTGITFLAFELVGKRLEILKEAISKVSRIGVLASPAHPGEQRELSETRSTARSLGISVSHHHVNTTADVYAALDAIAKENADALLAFPDPVTNTHRKQIAEFTVKQRLPSVFGWRDYVEAGGLMSYGPNHDVLWKRLAVYTDKILKGSKPSELPVELPTKFELVINLKTAKQIGVTITPNVLARADKVIK